MRYILFLLAFLIVLPAGAAELVMFESPYCEWCERWDEEVGQVYAKTSEARAAPLRRVDIDDDRPADLKGLRQVEDADLRAQAERFCALHHLQLRPTFVLMDKGREVGRITGYPGEEFFWGLLQQLLGRVEAGLAGCLHVAATDSIKGKSSC